jgi:hypothetical protein
MAQPSFRLDERAAHSFILEAVERHADYEEQPRTRWSGAVCTVTFGNS